MKPLSATEVTPTVHTYSAKSPIEHVGGNLFAQLLKAPNETIKRG